MALPQVETEVIEMVKEEEANAARQAALSNVAAASVADNATGNAIAIHEAVTQVAAVQGSRTAGNPMDFLAELGITDVKLDFTSFPIITLNGGQFSTPEHKSFGTEFECIFKMMRNQTLFRADFGRDQEPELVYSDDGYHCNREGKPIAEYQEAWKAKGATVERKEYLMVAVRMVGGPHDGELCTIQISPTSRGKWNGYLVDLADLGMNPFSVVTKVGVGAQVGTGMKAFNPFTFKRVVTTH